MITAIEVESYLKELKVKIDIFGILFLDSRNKNQQSLNQLEISPSMRKQVINSLIANDYSEGPLKEMMCGLLPMWVFGKIVRKEEVYIKVSMGNISTQAVCISFHIAEHSMIYPLKKKIK